MNLFQRTKTQLQLLAALTLVVLRTQRYRRSLMFWLTLILMGMTFVGGFIIMDLLAKNVFLFGGYWLFVFLLVILLLVLALYDMLAVSRDLRHQSQANAAAFKQDLDQWKQERRSTREKPDPRDSNS